MEQLDRELLKEARGAGTQCLPARHPSRACSLRPKSVFGIADAADKSVRATSARVSPSRLLKNGVWRFFRDPNVPGINQPFRRKMSLTPFFSNLLDDAGAMHCRHMRFAGAADVPGEPVLQEGHERVSD